MVLRLDFLCEHLIKLHTETKRDGVVVRIPASYSGSLFQFQISANVLYTLTEVLRGFSQSLQQISGQKSYRFTICRDSVISILTYVSSVDFIPSVSNF
jgi:hypothetical protein